MYTLYRADSESRVILDSSDFVPSTAIVIETIDAKTWIAARDQISSDNFEHREGFGYF